MNLIHSITLISHNLALRHLRVAQFKAKVPPTTKLYTACFIFARSSFASFTISQAQLHVIVRAANVLKLSLITAP